jgi:AraC family transcriptional regulator
MDWIQRMNKAISYIEDNLTSDIDYEVAAKITCCSVYHFQRMFSFILDVPISEYIRRRRLTLAALELRNKDIKVIDLALKYGYDSPDSFTRAFHNLHGVTPTMARNMSAQLKAYPRISFFISIKGDIEMNYRFVEKEAYTVFGKSITIGLKDDPYEVIPKFWVDFQEDGTYQKICRTAGFEPYSGKLLSSVAYDFNNVDLYKNKYMINTLLPQGIEPPKEFNTLTIPALKWVVFSDELNSVDETTAIVQGLWKRVFSEWFPTSEYEVADGPQLEIYPEDTNTVEIWIPVVKQ